MELPNLKPSTLYEIPMADSCDMVVQSQLVRTQFQISIHRLSSQVDKDIKDDLIGCEKLKSRGSWRQLANLTKQLIGVCETKQIMKLGELLVFRQEALHKLNLFQLANAELETLNLNNLLNTLDLKLFKGYEDIQGLIIPFALLVDWANLPWHLDNQSLSLKRLHQLLYLCLKMVKGTQGEKVWQFRTLQVQLFIVNKLIALEEFSEATQILTSLCLRNPDNLGLLTNLIKLHLLGGNLHEATRCLQLLEAKVNLPENKQNYLTEFVLIKGLVLIATEDFTQAEFVMQAHLQNFPEAIDVQSHLALTQLYIQDVYQAIQNLHKVVTKITTQNLHLQHNLEPIIFNLTTFYELQSNKHNEKKRNLLELTFTNLQDGFDARCFQFPS